MAVISELIRTESNGSLSFGDYTLEEKAKLDHFLHDGASFKVKTCQEITRLECNDIVIYESVPGTAVFDFHKEEGKVSFTVEGTEDAQITLGLEAESEYEISINGASTGLVKTNLGGKLNFSVSLEQAAEVVVEHK